MTDTEIVKALEEAIKIGDAPIGKYWGCMISKLTAKEAVDLINRQKAEIEKNENIIRLADKTIETANAEIERLKARLKQVQELYEERACLCEEQDRQIFELDLILANYPYMVHFGNGTVCTENYKEYERLLASISANAVNEVLEELENTLVINNEGNTEFFDYVYTLETIDGLKNRGVIFNV